MRLHLPWRGPFEAQRHSVATEPGAYADWFAPVRRYRLEAITDAERMGPGAIVRNTRTGRIVWRVYGLGDV